MSKEFLDRNLALETVRVTEDLAAGEVMFSATGVTDGIFLKGIIKNKVATTHSVVMRSKTKTLCYIYANHDLSIKNITS